jgi:hypothetical protein
MMDLRRKPNRSKSCSAMPASLHGVLSRVDGLVDKLRVARPLRTLGHLSKTNRRHGAQLGRPATWQTFQQIVDTVFRNGADRPAGRFHDGRSGSEPNSGHRDYSRLSCGGTAPNFPGYFG